jgi:hypothetical protein
MAKESATDAMPTTADVIKLAAAVLQPILPPKFFGKVSLIYEDGKPLRMVQELSVKL